VNAAIMTTATSMALLLSVGFLNHGPAGESAPNWLLHRPSPTVRLFEVSRFRWTGPFAACSEDRARQTGNPDCAFIQAPCGIWVTSDRSIPIVWVSRAFTVVCAALVVELAR